MDVLKPKARTSTSVTPSCVLTDRDEHFPVTNKMKAHAISSLLAKFCFSKMLEAKIKNDLIAEIFK